MLVEVPNSFQKIFIMVTTIIIITMVTAVNVITFTFVGFEVFTAVTMKNAVFWVVVPCRCGRLNRRFGGSYRLHLQGRQKNPRAKNQREQVASELA
jgi:hypothetical protein